jgi:hypothetical protein
MRSRALVPALAIVALAILTTWGPLGRRASAVGGPYSNDSFRGSYAMQFTGDVFVPAPFDKFNGKFYRNARVVADGFGTLDVTAVANYGGAVSRERYTASYAVNTDGTFTVTIVNLSVPFAPGVPNIFTFDGVLADGGASAKVVLSGVNLGGQQLSNIGSVLVGEFIRQ